MGGGGGVLGLDGGARSNESLCYCQCLVYLVIGP